MRRFFVVLAVLSLVFMLACSGGKKETVYDYPDDDTSDIDISDVEITDNDSDDSEISDEDSDNHQEPEDHDNPAIPDEDSDTPEIPEATENHKISGAYQIGGTVSGIKAALVECGKTDEIASAKTDANGRFSFNADISADKTYCVKAGNFASCFKGMTDHVANISEITNAAYLLDENCAEIRKSETKVRTYAKLGTGTWLGELDYSKLSGIKEGLKLLSSFLNTTDSKTLSEKIAADIQKTDGREFYKFFNGFKIAANKLEVVIDTENPDSNTVSLDIEGGSSEIAEDFKIIWTDLEKTTEVAAYKFKSVNPGEYTVRARLLYAGGDPIMGGDSIMGGDPIMETDDGGDPIMISSDFSTLLFLLEKVSGTIDVSEIMNKDVSRYIDNGIYAVIPKNTVIKKGNSTLNKLTYKILTTGDGSQVSKIEFGPDGAAFTNDSLYFVYELGTVFGGDPIMLTAKRANSDGSSDVLQSAGGDPIMLAAGGDPIMFSAGGDPIMQIASSIGGGHISFSAGGDPIMIPDGSDSVGMAAGGAPIMTPAEAITVAAGDPIMLGTSSSVMIAKTGHFSGFLLNSTSLPVSVDALINRWCDGSYYRNYSPVAFIKKGVEYNKAAGADKTELLSYLDCSKIGELGNDLYELINKEVGYQRNLNLFENIYYVSEFYNRMLARKNNGEVAAAKNGSELRSAIASLYTATTSLNRSSTLADMFDSSKIPLTYNGNTPADYSADALAAVTGLSEVNKKYAATKKDMMIFANYITTSLKGPDFSGVSSALTPDQFVCAWFSGTAANCSKVYSLNANGHVSLGSTEVTVAEAEEIFARFLMPMNSRLSDEEKLNLFRTYYLALKYAGTIFYGGEKVAALNAKLLETAYLVFDGINRNANAVSIVDTFDASANTVAVLENGEMVTLPYLNRLSSLTDLILLNVATSANVEKVLIKTEGFSYDKVTENTRTYYKPKGELKENSIILTPGELAAGLKPLKGLIGSENVDSIGNIAGKMTVVVNSKISGKTYSTQKTYEFLINDKSEGVESKPLPSNLSILIHDAAGSAIAIDNNPGMILNPGNKTYYPNEDGEIRIENLAPASYTISAFADGYYGKNVGVNVPENATLGVEIKLDEEIASSHADANLTLKVNINTVKHPDKVYIQIYDEDMELVANESAKFNEASNGYDDVNISINFGRYTLLAVGEEMYNYLEAITVNSENTVKEITIVAKNACGNGIIDAGEECETGDSDSTAVRCGDVFPASTNPENEAVCNRTTCVYDKAACGAQTYSNCGDGIIDPGEGCDGGTKACSEILGANVKGTAPCKTDCSDWVIAGNCTKTTAECAERPANTIWNDGTGRFTQTLNGSEWLPAAKEAAYGTTRDECVFSCDKGYKWDSSTQQCIAAPLSLGNICTGETSCFDSIAATECPAYGKTFFGQDAQYAQVGYCTEKSFSQKGSNPQFIVVDDFTHYEWHKVADGLKNWDAAEEYCRTSTYGATQLYWKLPTPEELLTIVDSGRTDSPLADIFTTPGHTFWAHEDSRNSENAWRINENGALESVAKSTENYVLCVHVNEYDAPAQRFTTAEETVTDNVSGLIWQKQYASSKSWAEALSYCEEASTGDKFDWRLPNRNELASLLDFTGTSDVASGLSSVPAQSFWSSTTSANTPNAAWKVDFADGSITAETKSETNYVLCVRSENECIGSDCVDACSFEPCRNIKNSTGVCTATAGTFICGCKSRFHWNNSRCELDIVMHSNCDLNSLPKHGHWNIYSSIDQTCDDDEDCDWYPSTTGEYNETPNPNECRFVCNNNYVWNGDDCVGKTRITDCHSANEHEFPENAEWHLPTLIVQQWECNDSETSCGWNPPASGEYSPDPVDNTCRFKCKEHYTWHGATCDADTQPAACDGLLPNASWWQASITQTWNGSDWEPSNIGSYSSSARPNECRFKCNANYDWSTTNLACEPGIKNEYCIIPDHTVYNTAVIIKQTWNGETEKWEPSEYAEYSETPSTQYCRYKCDDEHFWNGEECFSPCDSMPCAGIENSTNICIAHSLDEYECGCESGYYWTHLQCKQASNIGNICTGLDKCYNNSEHINCPHKGEEFFGQDAQYASSGFCSPQNFTINKVEDETTVIDNNTGLEWQQAIKTGDYTWEDAKNYCRNSIYAGYDDWRLPTPEELLTIVVYSRRNPAINTDYFVGDQTGSSLISSLWTSKSDASDTTYARLVSFYNGYFTRELKSQRFYFRCVRGKELSTATFTVSTAGSDEIVTDAATGLIWQKTYATDKTWNEALEYCNNLVYAGFNDWRLPNTNELTSLLNYNTYNPASNFPDMPSKEFWSSSTGNDYDAGGAWGIDFYSGNNAKHAKSAYYLHVRCVRSDICEEGTFWDGTSCVLNPCNADSCGGAEHSQCIPTSSDAYFCACDNAAEGYFWSGSECINPCKDNPCAEISHSTDRCTSLAWNEFICSCEKNNGYFWNGSACVNPCDANPCANFDNTTGSCTAHTIDTYTCGCNDSYYWLGQEQGCKTHQPLIICTEQNKCYNNSEEVECPSRGEDFFGQDAQYASLGFCSPQSFIITSSLEEKTVIDKNTWLEWQETIPDEIYTWQDAKDYCDTLVYADYDDWRLPTPKELLTFTDYSRSDPAANTDYFYYRAYSRSFWTSKLLASDSNKAFYQSNNSTTIISDGIQYTYYVRCVRGNELPNALFTTETVGGDEIVKDRTTGLIWQKTSVSSIQWQQALEYCENLTYAGFDDWKLPNINELLSLVNYDLYNPVSDFPGMTSENFWSSSTKSNYDYTAWVIKFESGRNDDYSKTSTDKAVRCVRSGLCEKGKFWNGSACVNPCDHNPCGNTEHYACTPTSAEEFVCRCDNEDEGYFWSGTACVNPCDPNPCAGDIAHWSCVATAWNEHYCGCEEGYIWTNSECQLKTLWSFEDDEYDTSSGSVSSVDNSAQYHWERMTTLGAKTGSYAMCSNNYNINNSTAEMTITVNIQQSRVITFYIKGSGEKYTNNTDVDYFTLYVDGNIKLTSKGTTIDTYTNGWSDWTEQSLSLTAGTHTLKFSYKKDNSLKQGYDRFCIDDLSLSFD